MVGEDAGGGRRVVLLVAHLLQQLNGEETEGEEGEGTGWKVEEPV